MNIGEMWDSRNWDDIPLEPEELSKTLEIHRRHREREDVDARKIERVAPIRSNNRPLS